MIHIAVPPPVEVEDLHGNAVADAATKQRLVITFHDFACGRLSDARFCQDMEAILTAVEVKKQLREALGTGILSLEDAHAKMFTAACETPSVMRDGHHPYDTGLSHNLVTFLKAVKAGSDKKPEPGWIAEPAKADDEPKGQ